MREVSLPDNWASLVAQCGCGDAWDVMQFNFATTDPHEVNWTATTCDSVRRRSARKLRSTSPAWAGNQPAYKIGFNLAGMLIKPGGGLVNNLAEKTSTTFRDCGKRETGAFMALHFYVRQNGPMTFANPLYTAPKPWPSAWPFISQSGTGVAPFGGL